ncbi:esterase/lipase family protein [Caulobacter hibisci]|uniref:Alpha/beta fold hydrolase n=1 Tax=Caulobacter hibisci TaxID=2035993 RepID=A0ABS0T2L2_9CAUL|nr:alpha/beta fold hydrolase [Caulobacter hibisci]MBI1685138.1 alpha/beta fold hydrolase [Caulobacter hibisci]
MTLAHPETLAKTLDDRAEQGVLLLHGHSRTGRSMGKLSARLQAAGFRTWAPTYSFRAPLPQVVDRLLPELAAFKRTFAGPLHIVAHSLGSLVARALVVRQRPQPLGRVVMLAPPNGGSEWADALSRLRLNRLALGAMAPQMLTARSADDEALLGPVDFELGIIAGDRALDPILPRLILPHPHDGKVSVAATRIAGMSDHVVLPVTHTLMIFNPRVGDQVLAYLGTGRFLGDDVTRRTA